MKLELGRAGRNRGLRGRGADSDGVQGRSMRESNLGEADKSPAGKRSTMLPEIRVPAVGGSVTGRAPYSDTTGKLVGGRSRSRSHTLRRGPLAEMVVK